jgi:hypothetical protein
MASSWSKYCNVKYLEIRKVMGDESKITEEEEIIVLDLPADIRSNRPT